MAAERGLTVLGVDSAPTAIHRAEEKAAGRSLSVRFVVGDALRLRELGERFDTVLDCGLFHVFDDEQRPRYVASLHEVLVSGGHAFVLCFSDRQPGDWGPRRVREDELRTSFSEGWRVDSIEETRLEITIDPDGARAWLARITRT